MKKALRPNIGTAILIGVDHLDPNHFGNSCPLTVSAAQDVIDYALIAKLNGLSVQTHLGEQATRQNILAALKKTSKSLKAGDFLMLTFSGLGGVVTNFGAAGDRPNSATWCLFNGQLLEAEIQQALTDFEDGVNILVISDAAGTWSGIKFQAFHELQLIDRQRGLPSEIAETVYLQNKDFYDAVYLGIEKNPATKSSVIWLSACQLNQTAFETSFNGYLTSAIKHVWNGAAFKGNYERFFHEILLSLPVYQSPFIRTFGQNVKVLFNKKPFSV